MASHALVRLLLDALATFDGARPAQAARTAGANGLTADRVPPAFCVYETTAVTSIDTKLREHAADFGLPQLEFTSFVRVTGYQSLLSASDTSYALSTLLECE